MIYVEECNDMFPICTCRTRHELHSLKDHLHKCNIKDTPSCQNCVNDVENMMCFFIECATY